LNNQIASTTKLLNSFHISCIRERREIENLYNEKVRLEAIVAEFKSNNEECLNKLKHAAYEEVKSVLMNSNLLLKFAVASVMESLRSNPELCDFMMYYNLNNTASTTYGSNYLSLMYGEQQQQHSFIDSYTALILEESEKLYNQIRTELTNKTMAAAASVMTSSLPILGNNTNNQKLTYTIDNTYQAEEFRYNNQNRNF